MSTKEKIDARIASNGSNGTRTFLSAGESCADGVMIEFVSDPSGLNEPVGRLLARQRKSVVTLSPASNRAETLLINLHKGLAKTAESWAEYENQRRQM